MELHIPTLALVAVFVAAILGVLLLLAWQRDRSTDALAWWGTGYLLGSASFALLSARGVIPDVLSIEISNGLNLLGYSFMFAGTRAFSHRETPVTVFLVAPLVWLIAMRVPAIASDINLRVVVVSGLQALFVALTAHEFWRGRGEPLLSRWPIVILLLAHITTLMVRMTVVTVTPVASHSDFFHSPAFALMAFGTVLFAIAFAFLLLSMTKERTELRHKVDALIDSLTGLANRRAFMGEAEAMIALQRSRSEPLAVLLADLDHFKKINDAFGHAIGDRVLKIFAATLRRCIGPNDLAGRLGGEEFAILLAGGSESAALELAERIRRGFTEAAGDVDGHAVAATVSIGVAASQIGMHDLTGLLGQADRALYQAKERGRNRVAAYADKVASEDVPPAPVVAHLPVRLRARARA